MAAKKEVGVKDCFIMTDGDSFYPYEIELFTKAEAIKKAKDFSSDGSDYFVCQIVGKASATPDRDFPIL